MTFRGRRRGFGAVVLLALAGSGCWPQPNAGPGQTRHNPFEATLTADNVAGLDQVWSTTTDGALSEPVVSGSRVVATESASGAGDSPSVRAVAASTGAPLWDADLPVPGGIAAAATFSGDEVWAAYSPDLFTGPPAECSSGTARLDPASGAIVGTDPSGMLLGTLVTSGDTVAHVSLGLDGCQPENVRLEVRDQGSGAVRFTYAAGDDFGVSLGGQPAIQGDLVFLAGERALRAFPAHGCGAPTCEPVWTATLPAPTEWSSSTYGRRVAVEGDTVTATVETTSVDSHQQRARSTQVVQYRAADGVQQRSIPVGGGLNKVSGDALAVADGTVYVVATRDAEDGTPTEAFLNVVGPGWCADCPSPDPTTRWTVPLGGQGTVARLAPVVGGDVVYAAVRTPAGERIVAAPAGPCGSPTCPALASVPVTGTPQALSVSGGRVLVSSADGSGGRLTALGLPA